MPLLGLPVKLSPTALNDYAPGLGPYSGPAVYNPADGYMYQLGGGYGHPDKVNKWLVKWNTTNWTYSVVATGMLLETAASPQGPWWYKGNNEIIGIEPASSNAQPGVTNGAQNIWKINLTTFTPTCIGYVNGFPSNPLFSQIGNGYVYNGNYGSTRRVLQSAVEAGGAPQSETIALNQPYPTGILYDARSNKLYGSINGMTVFEFDPDVDRYNYKLLCGRMSSTAYEFSPHQSLLGPSSLVGMSTDGRFFRHEGYLYFVLPYTNNTKTLVRYDLSQGPDQQLHNYGTGLIGQDAPNYYFWEPGLSMLLGFGSGHWWSIV